MMLRDSFIWRLLLFFVVVTKKNVSHAEITYGQTFDYGHTVIWNHVYDASGDWEDRCGTGLALSGDASFFVYGCPEYYYDSGRGDVHLKSRSESNSYYYDHIIEFRGENNNEHAGQHLTMSYDGRFFAIGIPITDESSRFSEGRVIVHENRSNNGIWRNSNQANEYTIYPARTIGNNTSFGDNVKFNSDGTVIAVSNSGDSLVTLQNVGSVTVYMLNGNTYSVMGAPIVGSTENGLFGFDIALSSNGMTLCVGERGANRVRVYQYDRDILLESWTQVGNSIEIPTTANDRKLQDDTSDAQFGYSVDISADGSQIIVGAPGVSDEKGEVYVYTYNTSNDIWVQRGSNFEGSISNARMGEVVRMTDDGEKIAISSPNYPLEHGGSGIAHVFFFGADLTGDWVQWGDTLTNPYDIPKLFESMELSGDGTVLSSSSTNNWGYILQWFALQYVRFCFLCRRRTDSLKFLNFFYLVTSTFRVTNA